MHLSCMLSTAYWGPVQYYTKFFLYESVCIEQYETYPKQTYRNRCELYGPNGLQHLQVPVVRGSFHKVELRNLKISYDTDWQKNHIKTIESAYRSSPFFEYYFDDVLEIYNNRYEYLLELNSKILEISLRWLHIDTVIQFSTEYNPQVSGVDYRDLIHPKKNSADPKFIPIPYMQGFEQRHGFIPNLSILDLIFNSGPESQTMLKQCIK